MEKKYQVIYIWSFIVVSGIILLMLYTPLGGSSLHKSGNRDQMFVTNTMDFGDGINSNKQYRGSTDFGNVDFNSASSLKSSRINNSTSRSADKYSGRGDFSESTTNNYVYTGNKEVKRPTQRGVVGGSLGVVSSNSYHKRNSTDKNENLAMNSSFGEGFSGAGVFGAYGSSNPNIQKATAALGTNLFDPGGSTATYTSGGPLVSPTGSCIPLGDGMYVLLMLLSLYVALMVKRKL